MELISVGFVAISGPIAICLHHSLAICDQPQKSRVRNEAVSLQLAQVTYLEAPGPVGEDIAVVVNNSIVCRHSALSKHDDTFADEKSKTHRLLTVLVPLLASMPLGASFEANFFS